MAAYAFHDTVPSVNVDFEMKQKLGAKQLARPKVTDVKPYAASARKQVERKVVNDKERKKHTPVQDKKVARKIPFISEFLIPNRGKYGLFCVTLYP